MASDNKKVNCWEFKRCGRQPGGSKEKELGPCPAASESRLDKIHGGANAGRACWVIAGTMCGGEVQGSFARKHVNCTACDFYTLVEREEGPLFQVGTLLLKRLKFG